MGTSRGGRGQARRRLCCLAAALVALALASCTGSRPMAPVEPAYEARALTQQREGLAVTAAPLSDDESRATFDVPLAAFDVQLVHAAQREPRVYPVRHARPTRSPGGIVHGATVEAALHAAQEAIKPFVMPEREETVAGFVYAHSDEGFKAFNIDLVGHDEIESFHYAVPVPGRIPTRTASSSMRTRRRSPWTTRRCAGG